MLRSKKIDTINNSDIYDRYKDLYLNEKEREGTSGCKKSRWHGTASDNKLKRN